jgi:hypothetical protein
MIEASPASQPGGGTLFLLAVAVVVGYLLWCALYPFKQCPRCAGKTRAGDGRGNYRERRECWRCHGRPYPRVGTRLLRVGRRG